MRHVFSPSRIAIVAIVAFVVLGTSGCRWFNRTNAMYAQSPESRPLEVPPDLDRPGTSGAMALPPPASATRSEMAPAPSAPPNGFAVAGSRDEVFTRVGGVLAGVQGLTIVNRAQILGTFDVDYQDAKFLVRITPTDTGAYVAAVDPRGLPAAGEPPLRLIETLRAALAN